MFTNPQETLQQMLANDPRINNILQLVNQNGGNSEKFFYEEAKRRNEDPQKIIKQTQELLSRLGK